MSKVMSRIGLLFLPILLLTGLAPDPKDGQPAKLAPAAKKADKKLGLTQAEALAAIKPLPLEAIPDNPPPHEGALFELSYRISQPDLILVEALEALPGRPITGERLVRPNGTISLGFYGDVHVSGLTCKQAKTKITLHLRTYLTDQALGLVGFREQREHEGLPPLPPPGLKINDDGLMPPNDIDAPNTNIVESKPGLRMNINVKLKFPFELDIKLNELKTNVMPGEGPELPKGDLKPFPFPYDALVDPLHPDLKAILKPDTPKVYPKLEVKDEAKPVLPQGGPLEEGYYSVAPEDTDRVFVDVTAYNTGVYYVLGAVGSPGLLPITGRETVLDALQYAAGFDGNVDPKAVFLYRPARGDVPRRQYLIDIVAIMRGERTANLQIFPGDRLIVGARSNTINLGVPPGK